MTKPIVKLTHRPLNNFGSVRVSEEMGDRANHPIDGKPSPHNGVDLLPSGDLTVFATHNGTVIKSDYQVKSNGKGWGNYVTIQSDDRSFYTRYAHLANPSSLKENQKISSGTTIGTAGKTGGATGIHLHFEILDSTTKQINPRQSLVEAFPEFTTLVEAGGLQGDLYGDKNDNTMVANTQTNYLYGLEGEDTYFFPTISGNDIVDDVDNSGKIVIGNGYKNVLLQSAIQPKQDSSNNQISNVWTYESLDLYRVNSATGKVSSDGDDLVIVKSAKSVDSSNSDRVTIKNFPFSKDRAFGFSLGKTQDGVTKTSKAYSEAFGSLFSATSSSAGGYARTVASSIGDVLCIYDNKGNELTRTTIDDYTAGINTVSFYSYGGRNYACLPFSSQTKVRDKDGKLYYRAGAVLMDKNSGRIVRKQIYASTDSSQQVYTVSMFGINAKEGSDYFYLTYSKTDSFPNYFVQKVSKADLSVIGDPKQYSWSQLSKIETDYGSYAYSFVNPITLGDGTVVKQMDSKNLEFTSPKYRSLVSSEITTNFNIPTTGTYKIDTTKKNSVVNIASDSSSDLLIGTNEASTVVITGREDNQVCRVNLPLNNLSQCKICSIDAGLVSLQQLVDGNYDSKLLQEISLPNSSHRKLTSSEVESLSYGYEADYYYYSYDGDYYYYGNKTSAIIP